MPVRPDGSQAWATSTRSPPMIRQPPSSRTISISSADAQAARLRRARARRLGGIEHVDVDGHVERVGGQLGTSRARRRPGGRRGPGKKCGAGALVLLPGARAHSHLVDALRRDDVHHPGHGRGVVVALAQELLAQVRMRVELQHAQVGDGGASTSITGTVAVWSPPSMTGRSPGCQNASTSRRARRRAARAARPSPSSQSPRSARRRSSRSRSSAGE